MSYRIRLNLHSNLEPNKVRMKRKENLIRNDELKDELQIKNLLNMITI